MKKLITIFVMSLLMQSLSAQTGLAPSEENGKYGYKNEDNSGTGIGSFVLPPKYDDAHYFFEGLAAVRIGDNWGFIDKNGAMKIPAKYSSVSDFYEGLALVSVEVKEGGSTYDKYGFINKAGAVVIPLKFYAAGGFDDAGLADVAIKDGSGKIKWGFINKTGTMVVPAKYDSLGGAGANGYIPFVLNGKVGFLNKKCVEVIHPTYDNDFRNSICSFSKDGQAVVMLNHKMGIIDATGKVVIPFKYDYIDAFREDMAMVEANNKWGFINATGTEVISLQYAKESSFSSGQALVWLDDGEEWTIDKTGNKIKLLFKPEIMDSTIFSGVFNSKHPYLTLTFQCQSNGLMVIVTANNKAHKFPGESGIIELGRLGIKDGDNIKATVINRKGCTVTMAAGGAISNGKGSNKGKVGFRFGH